ncbi:MAG: XrtA/PEP-CTERM system exopolysaccharide export protein [Alphaproteobacteria bacterium]
MGACGGTETLPTASIVSQGPAPDYRIGPADHLSIFVWRNPELSTSVPVRPDGRISVPLIEDLQAANKTPTQLARDIEKALAVYVQEPIVTVLVSGFVGTFDEQVRVIGEAARPQAIPYRANMTLLDVMIAVGGVTEFAAGNRATIVRIADNKQQSYEARLDDLLKDGDITANVQILPGDVLIIPEAWF